MTPRIARDPLTHFLLAGAAVWLLLAWRGGDADPASRAIAVSRERQAALAVNHRQLTGRAPTDAELDGLIARDVHEEVLYREALRLGLDQDDPVVRRRLAKKMDELAAAEAESAEPDDAALAHWLARHPDRFASGATVSFAQHTFAGEAAARAALARGGDAAAGALAFDLPGKVVAMPMAEMRERFGLQFAEGLAALKPAPGWQGPLPSGYGWHIVRLDARGGGAVPRLADVRERVADDWRAATAAQRRRDAYRLLREGYSVTVER